MVRKKTVPNLCRNCKDQTGSSFFLFHTEWNEKWKEGKADRWKEVSYLVFDAPSHNGIYEQRLEHLKKVLQNCPPQVVMVGVKKCKGKEHLLESLSQVEEEGGEGLMIRKPGSFFSPSSSSSFSYWQLRERLFLWLWKIKESVEGEVKTRRWSTCSGLQCKW